MVDTDLLNAAVGPMDQLVQALENLQAPTTSKPFQVPTFNGEGEEDLFVTQSRDVATENRICF